MSVKYLKVKIKSLASEAKIIKLEEHKALERVRFYKNKQEDDEYVMAPSQYTFEGLRHHRVTVVRDEARATQWAYAYLRGKKFSQIETKSPVFTFNNQLVPVDTHRASLLERTVKMVAKYGKGKTDSESIKSWLTT